MVNTLTNTGDYCDVLAGKGLNANSDGHSVGRGMKEGEAYGGEESRMMELRVPVEKKAGCSCGDLRVEAWRPRSGFVLPLRGYGTATPDCVPEGGTQKEEEISRRLISQRSTEFSSPGWCLLTLGHPHPRVRPEYGNLPK